MSRVTVLGVIDAGVPNVTGDVNDLGLSSKDRGDPGVGGKEVLEKEGIGNVLRGLLILNVRFYGTDIFS